MPTATWTPSLTRTSTPKPGPLTDAEALALIEEEMAARGFAPDTLRIKVVEKPRVVSVRYASAHEMNSRVFRAESVLITLMMARAVARIDPPVAGGLRVGVIPAGQGDVGLSVTVIDYASLEEWREGLVSDQEFVSQWTHAAVTKQ